MELVEEKNRNNLFLNDNTVNPAPSGLCASGTTTPREVHQLTGVE